MSRRTQTQKVAAVDDKPEVVQESASAMTGISRFTDPLLKVGSSDNEPIAEEYRKLKAVIMQTARKQGMPYILLVASAVGDEGKSVTAVNLALNIARDNDQHVVLVDADLRKPSLAKYLNLNGDTGLADFLRGSLSLKDSLVPVGVKKLLLMPAGKTLGNPVELLSSERMKLLIEQLRCSVPPAFVIIDTSPLLLFAEGRVLSSLVDGVIFVVKAGGASKLHISEALSTLKDANVLGLVCNQATDAITHRGYGYNYYSYYDHYRQGADQRKGGKPGVISRLFGQDGRR
ncbi:MAG: polysaccharide biosynthesis protein [Deltaproteobacteria bacterium HGW-Deltaproteobacteria-23]|jgi:exopolysaccharide/PEP-CTERM locus tyrosine autokinase|nr:MAG: polysaccharide biosynthesis protein [Deltaproteobacteria bacterium HGW-Deltaproteobacteria-23]